MSKTLNIIIAMKKWPWFIHSLTANASIGYDDGIWCYYNYTDPIDYFYSQENNSHSSIYKWTVLENQILQHKYSLPIDPTDKLSFAKHLIFRWMICPEADLFFD